MQLANKKEEWGFGQSDVFNWPMAILRTGQLTYSAAKLKSFGKGAKGKMREERLTLVTVHSCG